jgi:hypothetical protein
MAVSTFGVDASVVDTFYPQFQVRSDGPITSGDLTVLINASASMVNGILSATGFDPASVDADATEPAYFNARLLVLRVLGPLLAGAAEGYTASGEEVTRLEAARDKALAEFKRRPADLGVTGDSDYAPKMRGSVRFHDLSELEEDRAERNPYLRLVGRNSDPDRKLYW